VTDAVIVCDRDLKYTRVNRAGKEIGGVNREKMTVARVAGEFTLRTARDAPPLPREQWPLARAVRGESFDNQRLFLSGANPNNGLWLEVSGRPVIDEDGGSVRRADCSSRCQRAPAGRRRNGSRAPNSA